MWALLNESWNKKDASEEEARVQEINTGTFCFDNESLFEALAKTDTNNTQGEYYLTDIIEILKRRQSCRSYQMADFDEAMGVNDRVALSTANKIMHRRLNEMHMRNGVTFIDSDTTYIDEGVVIGSDTQSLKRESLSKENSDWRRLLDWRTFRNR